MSVEPAGASSAEVAAAIAGTATPALNLTPGIPPVGRAYGVVVSIQAGPPPSLTLTLGGSQKPIAGIRYMASYSPTVGDTVLVDHVGTDLVVRGALAKTSVQVGIPVAASVATSQATASTAYVDLATAGPSVTLSTGTSVVVDLTCKLSNSAAGGSLASVAVSGASILAAADANALYFASPNANWGSVFGARFLLTGLTPGVNTFTMKYKSQAATATFGYRNLTVTPL